jgi:Domain of unknown function (DUF4380)
MKPDFARGVKGAMSSVVLRLAGLAALGPLACPLGCNAALPSPNGADMVRSGDVSLTVDPGVGGRVVSLSMGGQNWLTGPDADRTNYGSTFWTSPQSDWNWPPPPEIDNLAYAASIDAGAVTLQGAGSPLLGVAVAKAFAPGATGGSVSLRYSIENRAAAQRSFAPWEVTRVRPAGLFFFPTGQSAHSAAGSAPLPTQQVGGVTWYDAATAPPGVNVKYFADGSRGWFAQANGGLLFVKKFPDVPPAAQAPGEAEIELYVNGDGAYVEMETQGAYQAIAPGASLDWSVRWFLVPIPAGVDASLGSPALVAFVDAL